MTKEHVSIYNAFIEEEKLMGHRLQGFTGLRTRSKKIFEYCEEKEIEVCQIGVKQAYDFQLWLIENGKNYANNTVKSYVTSASCVFEYLKRKKMIYSNPFSEIKKLKSELKLPRNILKEKEMNMLLNELSNFDKAEGMKNKIGMYAVSVISELMYSTGMRITEAAGLKVEDIDFERGLVRINEGKQGISRVALLNDYASKILAIYTDRMRELTFSEWNKKNDSLFGVGWRSFSKKVNRILKRASVKLNLPCITSHSFRHSLGFHLLRSGCDIRYIQAILGHKSLKSTEIYTKVEKEDLKEVFDKYHPRTFGRERKPT